ncbi:MULTISPECIES: hypothetical protein [unclassified Streptomyces]|uniref:hypothetical protein n=1 Tax=Streptomyces TaxID=1883 RepID=UPI0001C198A4|nr:MULTISPECIES: hypothetical protein [unclassified Streptomyces]AEN13769.1 conserved hypothetical protein [Streptomyces sp. SirexAA-E]MYR64600.1 hypothetical protein [Streptomyces sp. SID4939]MYR99322.1 hypothetical protein [Streptomyces sp. SID4940]MYT67657.1 hypothetical protein [Streptomyces sp. SID8357]MYT86501.1 hypothetical protein [Streptomyces sp. SID8360]
MTYQDERLRTHEDLPEREVPVDAGRTTRTAPRASRPRRTGHLWLWLVAGLTALGVGIAVGHGLLIAAGLVVAGAAAQLFDPDRRREGRRGGGARRLPAP